MKIQKRKKKLLRDERETPQAPGYMDYEAKRFWKRDLYVNQV